MSINNIPAACPADRRWLPPSLFITARQEEDLTQSFFSKRSKSTQSKPRLFNIVSAINNISPSSFVNVTLSPLLSYTRGICLASSPVCTLTCSCPADGSSWPWTSRVEKLHLIALVLFFSHLFLNEEEGELLKHTAASSFIMILMTTALMFRFYLQSAFTLCSLCD